MVEDLLPSSQHQGPSVKYATVSTTLLVSMSLTKVILRLLTRFISPLHHLISDLANLNIKSEEYTGSEQIRIDNGLGLPIRHFATTCLSAPNISFPLKNVLHVPHIKKNLFSIQKSTIDTNTFF